MLGAVADALFDALKKPCQASAQVVFGEEVAEEASEVVREEEQKAVDGSPPEDEEEDSVHRIFTVQPMGSVYCRMKMLIYQTECVPAWYYTRLANNCAFYARRVCAPLIFLTMAMPNNSYERTTADFQENKVEGPRALAPPSHRQRGVLIVRQTAYPMEVLFPPSDWRVATR